MARTDNDQGGAGASGTSPGGVFPRERTKALCTALLETLELFGKAQRRFHPAMMAQHGEALARQGEALRKAMGEWQPDPGGEDRAGEAFMEASRLAAAAIAGYGGGSGDLQTGVLNALKAGRKVCRAFDLLFPLRGEVSALDAFFREAPGPGVPEIVPSEGERLVHLGEEGDPYARGKASLYVPGKGFPGPRPLVLALHGGFGHGRDFIWSWLRHARSRGLVLLAPTSVGQTWAVMDPRRDLDPLLILVDRLAGELPLDPGRVLLSGLSDGGTFGLACAMLPGNRFSAFNPISGVLPYGDPSGARSRRIFWVHGAFDWMFPVQRAREGCAILSRAGADVTLEVLQDLAHAMPPDAIPKILSWFAPEMFPQP